MKRRIAAKLSPPHRAVWLLPGLIHAGRASMGAVTMSPSKRTLLPILLLLSLLVLPSFAYSQISYQVDSRLTNRPGRMYESNPMVGSGGANFRNDFGLHYPPGVYANQIVAGNVTGLAGFHGPTVIPGANQFRGSLQSDALSTFRAQSVGIQDIRRGQSFAPRPYYDPATSIADLGVIRYGMNQPGSSYLRATNVVSPTIAGTQTRDPLLTYDQPDSRYAPGAPFDDALAPGAVQRVIDPARLDRRPYDARAFEDRYRSAMQSTLFGTPPPPDMPIPARQGPGDLLDSSQSSLGLRDRLPGFDIHPLRDDRTASDDLERGVSDALPRPGSLDARLAEIGVSNRQVMPLDEMPGGGDDLYSRMQMAVNAARDADGVEGFVARRGEIASPDQPDERFGQPDQPGGLQDRGGPAPDRATAPEAPGAPQPDSAEDRDEKDAAPNPRREWAERVLKSPIRSLATAGPGAVARYMRSGEEALKQGDFLTAARRFDMAATIDVTNPLPLIARGNALIAAGQYMSAAASLDAAIRLFPEIAAFELDLVSLTGQPDVFDRRRADLEKLLAQSEQYELRFLLGYIELYSDLQFDGLTDLEKAAKHAPPKSGIAQLPDLLLGRRPLDRRPLDPRDQNGR